VDDRSFKREAFNKWDLAIRASNSLLRARYDRTMEDESDLEGQHNYILDLISTLGELVVELAEEIDNMRARLLRLEDK
jgi:hypothetical protein